MKNPFASIRFAVAACLVLSCAASHAAGPRPLRLVYYYPKDTSPLAGYQERLTSVVGNISEFYRQGMIKNGKGDKTFLLERDAQGKLVFHFVKGSLKLSEHERGKTDGKMNEDIDKALRAEGLDPAKETLLVFSNLLVWDGPKAIEVGPFHGGGGPNDGRCHAYDDPKLDPKLLSSKEPGGWYNRACTIGEFNSHYIGGIAHELGHALGLPHEGPTPDQHAKWGESLMGGGNHTYGEELRGEGKGSYLSNAAATILSRHPLFSGGTGVAKEPDASFEGCSVKQVGDAIQIDGKVKSASTPTAVIGYSDSGNEYTGYTGVAEVKKDGSFSLTVPSHTGPKCSFSLQVCFTDGGHYEALRSSYEKSSEGAMSIEGIAGRLVWSEASKLAGAGQFDQLADLGRSIQRQNPGNAEFTAMRQIAESWAKPKAPANIADMPSSAKSANVSDLAFESATVGWGTLGRDRVTFETTCWPFLSAGGKAYAKGLAAHADSRIALNVDGKWKTLSALLAVQEGSTGSVVFIVKGDGKELYRSKLIRIGDVVPMNVSIEGVKKLEMVTDIGDGSSSNDWSVWLNPKLER